MLPSQQNDEMTSRKYIKEQLEKVLQNYMVPYDEKDTFIELLLLVQIKVPKYCSICQEIYSCVLEDKIDDEHIKVLCQQLIKK